MIEAFVVGFIAIGIIFTVPYLLGLIVVNLVTLLEGDNEFYFEYMSLFVAGILVIVILVLIWVVGEAILVAI